MKVKKGDEELSFLEAGDKLRVEFDYSNITVGDNEEHLMQEDVFLKTREKKWRELWTTCRDSLYEPKFMELLHKYAPEDLDLKPDRPPEKSDHVVVVEMHNIQMKDMTGLVTKSVMGTSSRDRHVIIDYEVAFYDPNERSSPLARLEKKDVKGATMSFSRTFPEGNAIKNSMAVIGKNLGKQLDQSL